MVVVTVMMVVVTLVVPLLPPLAVMVAAVMTVVGLFDSRAVLAHGRQLTKDVTGGGSSLGATDGDEASKSARNSCQGENSLHDSSFLNARTGRNPRSQYAFGSS